MFSIIIIVHFECLFYLAWLLYCTYYKYMPNKTLLMPIVLTHLYTLFEA